MPGQRFLRELLARAVRIEDKSLVLLLDSVRGELRASSSDKELNL